MKKFVLYILALSIVLLLSSEVFLRIFGLANVSLPLVNLNGDLLMKPNEKGYVTKGGMAEIKSRYEINHQGWNSIWDYEKDTSSGLNVALIGDSYIAGFHVSVDSSIGRFVEQKFDGQIKVHEYGRDDSNYLDYLLLLERIKWKYDYIFILIGNGDFDEKYPKTITNGKSVPYYGKIREIYNSIHLIRYLNINHNLTVNLQKVLHKSSGESNNVNSTVTLENKSHVIYLYQEKNLDIDRIQNKGEVELVEITHPLQPIDHGFDSHWNVNGRKNCAGTIVNYLMKKE